MIDYISLEHVGPSAKMALQFGPRLNLLTGDNGLGKTFVLDIAWWALTRTWAGPPAMPPGATRESPPSSTVSGENRRRQMFWWASTIVRLNLGSHRRAAPRCRAW